MSKFTPKSQDFINEVTIAIKNSFYYSIKDVKVYYDAGEWNKRDYVADITLYSNVEWTSDDTKYLKECMREAGATSIIGGIKHAMARDYLDLAFDIKNSKLKELGIDKQEIV